jgi:phage tail-like protein
MSFPPLGYNFVVTLVDSTSSAGSLAAGINGATAGFSEVSGLESKLDIEEFKEGGRNDAILKFPTRGNPSPLTLKRGIARTDELWRWHEDFLDGRGHRKDGIVTLLDERREPVRAWTFRRGLPAKWTGPSLKASANEVAIESLEIVHEGLRTLSF